MFKIIILASVLLIVIVFNRNITLFNLLEKESECQE